MKDRRVELKVKIKSLAEEARIIRLEEKRAKARGDYRLLFRLQEHRRGIVRQTAHESLLAYHLVRGTTIGKFPYDTCRKPLPLDIKLSVSRFGPVRAEDETETDYNLRFAEWKQHVESVLETLQNDQQMNSENYNRTASERANRRMLTRQRCESQHAQRRAMSPERRAEGRQATPAEVG